MEEIVRTVVMLEGMKMTTYLCLFVTDNALIVAKPKTGTFGKAFGFATTGIHGVKFASSFAANKIEKGITAKDVLSIDKKAKVFSYNEIEKIEFNKYGRGAKMQITANGTTKKWYILGITKHFAEGGDVGRSAVKKAIFDIVPDTIKKESTFD